MKLFVFYVGGKTAASLIEVHDLRFAIGETVEECHESLRQQWWGEPQSLHIDCFASLSNVDGHTIELKNEPPLGNLKLYFVNLGGYRRDEFTELHRNICVVAITPAEAKVKALKQVEGWDLPHKDNLMEVDSVLNVGDQILETGLHIHLVPTQFNQPFSFTCGYFPIGRLGSVGPKAVWLI